MTSGVSVRDVTMGICAITKWTLRHASIAHVKTMPLVSQCLLVRAQEVGVSYWVHLTM